MPNSTSHGIGTSSRLTLINSATGQGKGTWTQLTADSGNAAHAIMVCIVHVNPGRMLLDIGVGAAASEQVIIPNLYWESINRRAFSSYYYLPVYIPSHSRIAARIENDDAAGIDGIDVAVITFGTSWLQPEMMHRVQDYGTITGAASKITAVDAGATVHTKGAWTQLIASTTDTIRWLIVTLGGNANSGLANADFLHDIGVGAGGSEEIIAGDLYSHSGAVADDHLVKIFHFPCYIPAGSRIAIRSQSETNDGTDRLTSFGVYGVS